MQMQRLFTPTKQDNPVVQVIPEMEMRESTQELQMSQSSVQEEYCQTHGDLFVALDKKRNELVCNQCIYAEVEDVERAFEQLTFTSYVASNLKDLFDEKFSSYKSSLTQMNQIAPQQISAQLESTVSHFFETVDNQIKEVEQSVLNKI